MIKWLHHLINKVKKMVKIQSSTQIQQSSAYQATNKETHSNWKGRYMQRILLPVKSHPLKTSVALGIIGVSAILTGFKVIAALVGVIALGILVYQLQKKIRNRKSPLVVPPTPSVTPPIKKDKGLIATDEDTDRPAPPPYKRSPEAKAELKALREQYFTADKQ